jgi:hypothetical protein
MIGLRFDEGWWDDNATKRTTKKNISLIQPSLEVILGQPSRHAVHTGPFMFLLFALFAETTKSRKLNPWTFAAMRAPCVLHPLPLSSIYSLTFFFISSCVCRNESKISEINSPRRLRRTTKKNTNVFVTMTREMTLHLHYFLGLFVYGATCICLMLIYLYFIFFFPSSFFPLSCRFLYLYFFLKDLKPIHPSGFETPPCIFRPTKVTSHRD